MKILLTALAAILLLAAHLPAAEARRPNILFILTDDQSPFDFKFYNARSAMRTPNIDRLAAGGMVLQVVCDADAAELTGSRTALAGALANLVTNARQAMDGRGVVLLEAHPAGDGWVDIRLIVPVVMMWCSRWLIFFMHMKILFSLLHQKAHEKKWKSCAPVFIISRKVQRCRSYPLVLISP